MLTGTWDRSAYAMESRILRPLLWFGLLEYCTEKSPDSRIEKTFALLCKLS
jgi:hypothetical protein